MMVLHLFENVLPVASLFYRCSCRVVIVLASAVKAGFITTS